MDVLSSLKTYFQYLVVRSPSSPSVKDRDLWSRGSRTLLLSRDVFLHPSLQQRSPGSPMLSFYGFFPWPKEGCRNSNQFSLKGFVTLWQTSRVTYILVSRSSWHSFLYLWALPYWSDGRVVFIPVPITSPQLKETFEPPPSLCEKSRPELFTLRIPGPFIPLTHYHLITSHTCWSLEVGVDFPDWNGDRLIKVHPYILHPIV